MRGGEARFGRFRLDQGRRELSRDGVPIHLGGRVLDILGVLVAAKGAVVSKDELMARVWPGQVVEEGNIHVQVSALRKALDAGTSGQSHVVTVPGRGYRLIGLEGELAADTEEIGRPEGLLLPDRPSIAVLAFVNLSEDPAQDYFADGIVEDIITALSRMRWLFVIARNSSFTYKEGPVDVRQVGRELGVRYVLEGSVRKTAGRVRIAGQLIDAATGTHLWADRFDGPLADIFDLQDQVTAGVVGAIAPKLEQAEIARAKRKPTERLDSYDYYLRGMASVYQWTSNGIGEALQLFHRAIEIDPEFATGHGMAAWCHLWRHANGWATDRAQETAETARLARRAAELGKDDAVALSFGGLALAYVGGDLEGGVALIDRALLLNPNLTAAWYASAWVKAFLGETDAAIAHAARAMRLSPLDPLMFVMQAVTALAHFVAGNYAEAAAWAAKAAREQPNFLGAIRNLAASSAFAGHLDEARTALARALELDPELRISNLRDRVGPYRPVDFARFVEGMRLAGLGE
jgi:TolB-like protein/tetratricopeptide (TPR) repeat protein